MITPFLSLVVPTRQRPDHLRRFLASVADTARRPHDLEIVLVIDEDDPDSRTNVQASLTLRHVIVPPGLPMGALNRAGAAAARGRFVMLLNDDVVARTPGWDLRMRDCLRRFPDDVVLVHVNDTLFRDRLCTFPLVSRTFCRLAGGICPEGYVRYRIDDHIEDIFNLLAALGKRRTVYCPDLVFEHLNTVARPEGDHVYAANPDILAADDARFEALASARKELVLRLLEHIEGSADPAILAVRRRRLAQLDNPFLLRVPGRQRVERSAWLRHALDRMMRGGWRDRLARRIRDLLSRSGYAGLLAALAWKAARLTGAGLRETDLRLAALRARYPAVG